MGIALPEQVFSLVDFVGGVHGYKNGADPGRSPEGDIPGGHIGCPDSHFGACPDAHGYKRPRETVHIITEFRIGPGIIKCRVFERILVREFFHQLVQHTAECQVYQLVFFPDIFSCTVFIEIQAFFLAARVFKTVHIVQEMGENNIAVGYILNPFRFPFKGDETVIVNGRKGVHHITDRQGAFADEVVGAVIVGIT